MLRIVLFPFLTDVEEEKEGFPWCYEGREDVNNVNETTCLWPSSSSSTGKQDGLLWYKDSGHHLLGEFSMAVVQANNLLEDQSQVETLDSGPYGTFIGIYDGHGGPETSRFVNDHLFHHLKSEQLNHL